MKRLLFAILCLCISGAAQATMMITNGDFEAVGGSNIEDVSGWYDYNTGNFWEGAWETNSDWITPNGTNVVVFSSFESDDFGSPTSDINDGSYIYQSIGTADGQSSVEIAFDWGAPDDDPGSRELGITIGIYAYDGVGTFAAADNTDVRGADGVTLLDSVTFTMTSTGIDDLIESVSALLNISAAGDQELFLRINGYTAGSTESWPAVDNVSIVPEPCTLLLMAAGGIMMRRKIS